MANDRAGFDVNNRSTLTALSSDGLGTVVPLWADPVTHQLLTLGTGGGGSGGTQYTQGGTATPLPTGNAQIYFDGSNNPLAVKTSQPLPVQVGNGSSQVAISTPSGDAMNGASSAFNTQSFTAVYSGSANTWHRMRTAGGAANTGGTGLLGVGILGYDGTNYQLVRIATGALLTTNTARTTKSDSALTLTSTTTETTLIAAAVGALNDIYGLVVTNTSATATEVIFRDVAAGTPRFSLSVPGNDTRGFMLSPDGAYKQTTANTAWTAQCGTSVASVKINALYTVN